MCQPSFAITSGAALVLEVLYVPFVGLELQPLIRGGLQLKSLETTRAASQGIAGRAFVETGAASVTKPFQVGRVYVTVLGPRTAPRLAGGAVLPPLQPPTKAKGGPRKPRTLVDRVAKLRPVLVFCLATLHASITTQEPASAKVAGWPLLDE